MQKVPLLGSERDCGGGVGDVCCPQEPCRIKMHGHQKEKSERDEGRKKEREKKRFF